MPRMSLNSCGLPTMNSLAGMEFNDLVLGGENYCQDIHFSAFYLRASLSKYTRPLYPGYSFILALYEQGRERYFIEPSEAENTSRWIIDHCLSNPNWLQGQLDAIEAHSEKLGQAFPGMTECDGFRSKTIDDLIRIYEHHNSLHRSLYLYARIPEALDRGQPFFTEYLMSYLRRLGVQDDLISTVFEGLTTPRIPSVIEEENCSFSQIVDAARILCPDLVISHTPYMFLPIQIQSELRLHRERWGWLSYHGYRHPELPTEYEYIRRLRDALAAPKCGTSPHRYDSGNVTSHLVPHGIDEAHMGLFRVYSEIGRVKLFRRYHQLRNFYFLDRLLREFSWRLSVPEWDVRCCLPEELVAALQTGRIDPQIRRRENRCAIMFHADGEEIVSGDDVMKLLDRLTIRKKSLLDPNLRHGTTACTGFARGIARVVGQKSDGMGVFESGNVLVCEAADPDLLPMIKEAAAVVSQQGGVTSHASVLCREIGVPTIVGVSDLLEFVSDGDEIEVDATAGIIRRVRLGCGISSSGLIIPRELWDNPKIVGYKTANLTRAAKLGFRVPQFAVLSWDVTRRLFNQDKSLLEQSLLEIARGWSVRPSENQMLLFRSTDLTEGGAKGSRAGQFVTVEFSIASNPLEAVQEFISKNGALGYSGEILFQRFLPARISGVAVDGDKRAHAEHRLIVEFVQGTHNTMTSGHDQGNQLVYDYRSEELKFENYVGDEVLLSEIGFQTDELISWLRKVAQAFGRPTYTEWGFLNRNYWLYQVRGASRN